MIDLVMHKRATAGTISGRPTDWSQNANAAFEDSKTAQAIRELLKEIGGRQEARTPGLRVANAALSQLS
jgi:hypothetical protein